MPRGVIRSITSFNGNGDLLTTFKPLNEVLSSFNSKIQIPLNLVNRGGRRISYSLLELLIETSKITPEWRLRLGNVSITRQFRPVYSIELSNGRYLHKFIYDVTSILNTQELINRESVNLYIKYEGGDPSVVQGILLDTVYEDKDAKTEYSHLSGLLLIEGGERTQFNINTSIKLSPIVRFILYSPRKISVKMNIDKTESIFQTTQRYIDEYVAIVDRGEIPIEISVIDRDVRDALVVSSITAYNSIVKQPILELCRYDYVFSSNVLKLTLGLCNKSETLPDKFIISILHRGNLLTSISKPGLEIPPGSEVRTEIELPLVKTGELQVRLIWLKLTKRWISDHVIRL